MSEENSEQRELGELGLHQLSGKLLEDVDAESELWHGAQPAWPPKGGNGIRTTKSGWKSLVKRFQHRVACLINEPANQISRRQKPGNQW